MQTIAKRIAALLAAILLFAVPAMTEEMNVLLIGVDTAESAGRSDTMMLARILPETGQVKLVSFLRDLYVKVPGYGSNRLNAAYFYGGEALLRQTLQENFGLTIHRYATVRFSTLTWLVDELGGVTIELTEAERQQMNKLLKAGGNADMQLTESGQQLLNGRQALAYSRIRKLDSDFQRTRRQQALLKAMLPPLSQQGIFSLTRLAAQGIRQVDTDLGLADLAALAPLLSRLEGLSVETAQVPFEGTYQDATISGMMVLKPDMEQNRRKLREFLADQE